jgi:flagella basal body P-ring formation protein FlgA
MRGITWLAALALALGAAAEGRAEGGRITVERAATVAGETLRLADVAALEGAAAALADLDLGPAPEPGTSRRLDGRVILGRLRAAGLDETATRYVIPATVRVERAAQEVGVEELRAAVEAALAGALGPGERLRALDVPGPARIPVGPYEIRVAAPAAGSRGGWRRLAATVLQEGRLAATVPVRAAIEAVGPVVIVRRPVARGTLLGAADLAVEERDLAAAPAGVFGDLGEAIGREARVALVPGTPLTGQQVASPLLVRRGDAVTVVVETPGMRLSVAGEALEEGAAGAAVRVRNGASRQELAGRVVERGVVLVQY